jgi:hypothetical protein
MSRDEFREGYYQDKYGRWQKDRRSGNDRRRGSASFPLEHERRKMFRRKQDRELLEKDHRAMIEDALEDFAEEHGGHL